MANNDVERVLEAAAKRKADEEARLAAEKARNQAILDEANRLAAIADAEAARRRGGK